MTAPIQEPSTDRALQGFAYQRDQLLRRPAPVGGGVNETAGYFGIDITGSSDIPPQTWTDVGSIGAALLTYTSTQNDSGYSVDADTCVVSWTTSILCWVLGQVRFSEAFTAGDTVALRLEFGGTGGATDVMNTHSIPAGGASFDSGDYYFDVNAFNFVPTSNVSLFLYHDHTANRMFESADLTVMTVAFDTELDVVFP